MMPMMVLVRDGAVVMRLIEKAVTEHGDGTFWSARGNFPVLNSFAGHAKDGLLALVKAKRTAEIPAECFVRRGENPGGLLCITEHDWERHPSNPNSVQARAAREAAISPAERELRAINNLFARSEAARHATDDDQMDRHFRLSCEAESRLKAWKAQYPAEAKLRRADALRDEAAHQESLAAGALTYDADGWIGSEEQEKRAAEYKAKAAELRGEACRLTLEARG
jgi:hypothetical protein